MTAEPMTKEKHKIKVRDDLTPPPQFHVIFVNDDVTTVEFVIMMLCHVFDYDLDRAKDKTQRIHDNGSAIVATLPYELAEQKSIEVTILARNNNFPLDIRLEPEA
jgi:ATP-dependent Clp protease adaptor protein ClpS